MNPAAEFECRRLATIFHVSVDAMRKAMQWAYADAAKVSKATDPISGITAAIEARAK